MAYLRSAIAAWLILVWSIITIFTVLSGQPTGFLQFISPPLFFLVGGLLGLDVRKVWRDAAGK